MQIDKLETIFRTVDRKYLDNKKDGLDSFRGVVEFLRHDALEDIKQIRSMKNPYMKYKIQKQVESWTLPQLKHYCDKIDKYIKENWIDRP